MRINALRTIFLWVIISTHVVSSIADYTNHNLSEDSILFFYLNTAIAHLF